jgi:hypothetical protein
VNYHHHVLAKTIECATPPEFPNGVPNIWSPEHLFMQHLSTAVIWQRFWQLPIILKVEIEDFSCKTIAKIRNGGREIFDITGRNVCLL